MMNLDYRESMRASAEQLDKLRDLGLGFSWEEEQSSVPTSIPVEVMEYLSSSLRQKPSSPITLSSSSSNTEDDVPLSCRVKRPKVQLYDDVSVRRPESHVGTESGSAAACPAKGQPTLDEREVQPEASSPRKAPLAAPPMTAKPEGPKMPQDAGTEAGSSGEDAETAQEASAARKAHAARAKQSKAASQAGKSTSLKETVIDLEAEEEPQFDFSTAPKSKPLKAVGLKKLKNENPKLYQAALKRYGKYAARSLMLIAAAFYIF